MTFVEMLELIGQRNEVVYTDKVNSIRTDQRFYTRDTINGQNEWVEKSLPEDDHFIAPRKPIEIPVATKKVSTYTSAVKNESDTSSIDLTASEIETD